MLKKKDDALDIKCTVTGNDKVAVKWKSKDGDIVTKSDKSVTVTPGTYKDGKLDSTLNIAKLALTDSKTYTCYTEFGTSEQVKQEIQLHVVG
jgi:hypothetical protein